MNAPVRSGSALLSMHEVVNQAVDFDLQPGEIHALLVIEPDAGEVRTDGAPVRFADPRPAQTAGVATIFQETRRAIPPSAAIPSYRPSTINRLLLRNNNEITLRVMAIVPLRDYGRGSKQAPGPNQKRTMSVEQSAPRAGNTTRRKLNDY
jgi:hypothetical protein